MLRRCVPVQSTSAMCLRSLNKAVSFSRPMSFMASTSMVVAPQTTSMRNFHSSTLEAAMRVTTPSTKHPATGENTANLQPDDVRVVWREHYCPKNKRPYYHNLITNELSWAMPDGFPTRFEAFYAKTGGPITAPKKPPVGEAGDVKGTTAETTAAAAEAEAAKLQSTEDVNPIPGKMGMKERVKQYGAGGFALYLIIHNLGIAFFFTALMYGVDVTALLKSFGFNMDMGGSGSLIGTFFLAVTINKLFVPLQLMTTLMLAPALAPRLTVLCRAAGTKIFGWKY